MIKSTSTNAHRALAAHEESQRTGAHQGLKALLEPAQDTMVSDDEIRAWLDAARALIGEEAVPCLCPSEGLRARALYETLLPEMYGQVMSGLVKEHSLSAKGPEKEAA